MTDFEKVVYYVQKEFVYKNIDQLSVELKRFEIYNKAPDIYTYAFYIMNKSIKIFDGECNHCLKVALVMYALLYNSKYDVCLHIGYIRCESGIIPHSWITIDGRIIDMRVGLHIDLKVI